MIVLADDLESCLPKLALDDRERHLVSLFRSDRARSPIHDDQVAAGPKRSNYMVEHQFRIAEFVVSVTEEHSVHSTCWQVRIVVFPDNDVNIVLTPQ